MRTKTIAIYLHHPNCSVQSVNGVMKAIGHNYRFKIFTKHPNDYNFYDDVDLICFPGGLGHSDSFDSIAYHHVNNIRHLVSQGRPYLGICMGAYWSDQFYFDILKDTRVVQYIKQPQACTHRPHAKAMPIVWGGEHDHMFFYDGCTFQGGIYETVAFYANSQYPMAMVQDHIGLVGCHPESEEFWYLMYPSIKVPWHRGKHFLWLEQLVRKLL